MTSVQILDQIHKMTCLAKNPAATCCFIMYPVILRNKSGISDKIIDCRNLICLHLSLDLLDQRCMSPVQTHKQFTLGLLISFLDRCQFIQSQTQRLLAVDILFCLQCFDYKLSMAVVLGGYGDQINLRITQQFLIIIGGITKRCAVIGLCATHSASGCQSAEFKEPCLLHDWQHGTAYKVSSSDQSQADLLTRSRSLRLRILDPALPFRIIFIIFQKNTDIALMIRILGNHLISFCRFFKRDLMSNNICKADSALRQQTHKLFNVTAFSKTHIANRVINTLLLIGGIITACSIGTGNSKGQLPLIVRTSVNVHLSHTNHADNATISGNRCSQIHRCIAVSRCGNNHLVYPTASGQCFRHIRCIVITRIDKCLQPGTRHGLIYHIVTDHIASVSIQDPTYDLPHQSHTDDCHGLSRNHFCLMDSFQSNTSQRAECCLAIIGQFLRYFGQHGTAYTVDLTMVSGSHHCHQISGLHLGHTFSTGNNTSHTGISHRHRLCQLVKSTLNGSNNSIC